MYSVALVGMEYFHPGYMYVRRELVKNLVTQTYPIYLIIMGNEPTYLNK